MTDPPTPSSTRAGPRRLVFNPNGKIAYVVNELQSGISHHSSMVAVERCIS